MVLLKRGYIEIMHYATATSMLERGGRTNVPQMATYIFKDHYERFGSTRKSKKLTSLTAQKNKTAGMWL